VSSKQNAVTQTRIRDAFSNTDEELYLELGRGNGPSALPSDPRDLIELGKKAFLTQSKRVRVAVCSNPNVRRLSNKNPDDNVAIAIEVLNVIASLCVSISPIPLAVLLVRKGLRNMCDEQWKGTNALS
jgi:hypothetical protein